MNLIYVRRAITAALTSVAFWNSYSHTVDWFANHGQASASGMLGLIPEAGVILVLISLAIGGLSKAETAVMIAIGTGSLAVTFTANLSGASAGPMGVAASLVAPTFAVLGFALELAHIAPKPKAKTRPRKPATVRRAPKASLVDTGILWATARGGEWPTTKEIMEQYPTISKTTAGKIRKARPASVNA